MPTGWIVSNVAQWIVLIVETVLLLLLLRALGELRRQEAIKASRSQSPDDQGLEIGTQAPSFSTTDTVGNTVQSQDLEGKKWLLAFISPECTACSKVIEV